MTATATMVDAAIAYAEIGYYVLPLWPVNDDGTCACPPDSKTRTAGEPCRNPGKHPIGALIPRGNLDATRDPQVIRQWWALWPDANIGLDTERSGLVCIAPDCPQRAAEFAERGLPAGPVLQSGGGAGHLHHYTRRPTGCPITKINYAQDFDIIASGLVVAAPSRHASGRRYTWLVPLVAPHELPATPAWAVALLTERAETTLTAVQFSDDAGDLDLAQLVYDTISWQLSERIRAVIEQGPQAYAPLEGKDGSRSGADAAIVTALLRCGLTADQIRAVFRAFPIGRAGKYADAGSGDRYLARTIAQQQAWLSRQATSNGQHHDRDAANPLAETVPLDVTQPSPTNGNGRHHANGNGQHHHQDAPDDAADLAAEVIRLRAELAARDAVIETQRRRIAEDEHRYTELLHVHDLARKTVVNPNLKPGQRVARLAVIFRIDSARPDADGWTETCQKSVATQIGVGSQAVSEAINDLVTDGVCEKRVTRVPTDNPRETHKITALRYTPETSTVVALERTAAAGAPRPKRTRTRDVPRCPEHPQALIAYTGRCVECGTAVDRYTLDPDRYGDDRIIREEPPTQNREISGFEDPAPPVEVRVPSSANFAVLAPDAVPQTPRAPTTGTRSPNGCADCGEPCGTALRCSACAASIAVAHAERRRLKQGGRR